MIKDAMILSDNYFNFLHAINTPEEYIKLDDNIINIIENFNERDNPGNKDLLKAANIIKRLRNRDLYKFVGQILIPKNYEKIVTEIKLEDIICFNNPKDEMYLTTEDLEISYFSIDYGNGERNPFSSILFYKNEKPYDCFPITSNNKISLAMPAVFKETYLNMFCKDKKKLPRAKEVFNSFYKES